MELLSSFNFGVKHFLCVIDGFTKFVLVKTLKDKKSRIILCGFVEKLNLFKCKPNKLRYIKEYDFIKYLCKNGYIIMIFWCNQHIMKASQ